MERVRKKHWKVAGELMIYSSQESKIFLKSAKSFTVLYVLLKSIPCGWKDVLY